jgi:hypothetical protein
VVTALIAPVAIFGEMTVVVRWWSVVVRWHPLGRCWRPRMNRLLAQRGKAPCRCPRLRSRRRQRSAWREASSRAAGRAVGDG